MDTTISAPGIDVSMLILAWLGQAVLFGTALTVLTWLVVRLLGRRLRPELHAVLWLIVLLKFVIPVGPGSAFSLASVGQSLGQLTLGGIRDHETDLGVVPSLPAAGWLGASSAAPVPPALVAETPTRTWSWGYLLAGAYATGLLLVVGIRIRGYRRFAAECRSHPAADGVTRARVHFLCRRFNVRRLPDVLASDESPAPYIIGMLRPILVLPRRLASTTDELEAVVLHEIAHLKRRDMLVRQLQWCVGTALYFWPIVAWVNRRIDLAREQACDAFALRHGKLTVREYARCLQKAAQPPRPWFRAYGPAAMASAPGTLERRIDMILRTKTQNTPRRLRLAGAGILMAWSVFVLTGAVAPAADSAPGAEPVLAAAEDSPDYRVVAPLIKMLKDEDPAVRVWAARGLCCFMDERAIEPLIAALGDEDKDVRACVIRALGSSKDTRVVEPLIAAMGDKDPDVRESVVRTLGCLDDPKAKAALIKALEDEDADVREWAVRCLSASKNCAR